MVPVFFFLCGFSRLGFVVHIFVFGLLFGFYYSNLLDSCFVFFVILNLSLTYSVPVESLISELTSCFSK